MMSYIDGSYDTFGAIYFGTGIENRDLDFIISYT